MNTIRRWDEKMKWQNEMRKWNDKMKWQNEMTKWNDKMKWQMREDGTKRGYLFRFLDSLLCEESRQGQHNHRRRSQTLASRFSFWWEKEVKIKRGEVDGWEKCVKKRVRMRRRISDLSKRIRREKVFWISSLVACFRWLSSVVYVTLSSLFSSDDHQHWSDQAQAA